MIRRDNVGAKTLNLLCPAYLEFFLYEDRPGNNKATLVFRTGRLLRTGAAAHSPDERDQTAAVDMQNKEKLKMVFFKMGKGIIKCEWWHCSYMCLCV